jgi:gliding motility-associated-like protein
MKQGMNFIKMSFAKGLGITGLLLILVFTALPALAQYEVSGGSGTPLFPANIPSPMQVYLLDGLQGARIAFTSDDGSVHKWYRYKDRASNAEPVACVQTGNTSYITDIEDGCGYFVGESNVPSTRYVWIIDYSKYLPTFRSFRVEEDEEKCDYIRLIADIEAPTLYYYTPTGVRSEITRTYVLKYTALQWQEDNLQFVPEEIVDSLKGLVVEKVLDAPLTDTDFTLAGDAFAAHFGKMQALTTPVYQAVAVEAHGYADRKKEKAANEFGPTAGSADLGGSAPIDFTFSAYANEPVAAMYIWKIEKQRDPLTWEPVVRYTDRTLHYTFNQDGLFRVALEVIGRDNCVDSTQTFTVTIGASDIRVPQAFSPGSSPGVNDEFRVAYSSILSFKCVIFNRWGTKLFEWDDPAKGWDGRVNGKLVPTGAYFYIIQYTGTDHKSHTKKGSVNVLRGKE